MSDPASLSAAREEINVANPEAIYTVTTAGLRAALKAAYAVDFGRRTQETK